MKVTATPLAGLLIIELDAFKDARGLFVETYQAKRYAENGIAERFVQDNCSRSVRGALRGLHFQVIHPQGKLIRAVAGEVFDVAVDIRPKSPTYKKWFSVTLSAENFRQCYVPPGFAHGFYTVSETAEVEYKCTDFYDPAGSLTIRWNDPALAIQWPTQNPLLSTKDRDAPTLSELEPKLPIM